MKKTLIALLLLLPAAMFGQTHVVTASDSAARALDRYQQLLNIDALPQDRMLVIETAIAIGDTKDTIRMTRWYAYPEMMRVEVINDGKMETGLVTNGKDRFKRFRQYNGEWEAVKKSEFDHYFAGFDFRGPLYHWRIKGLTLTWMGNTTLKGQTLQVVKVQGPEMFDRYYMFDPNNGLLTLIIEEESPKELYDMYKAGHVEWKAIHEFMPVGESLLPSLESFARKGVLTVLSSQMHFEPLNTELFNRD